MFTNSQEEPGFYKVIYQVELELKVSKEKLDQLVLKEIKETLVLRVISVLKETLVSRVQKVPKVKLDQLVL